MLFQPHALGLAVLLRTLLLVRHVGGGLQSHATGENIVHKVRGVISDGPGQNAALAIPYSEVSAAWQIFSMAATA